MADSSCSAPTLLREWREKRDLSQAAAAELVGVRQNTWSDWENGRKKPHIEQALTIDAKTDGDVPVHAWSSKKTRKKTSRKAA